MIVPPLPLSSKALGKIEAEGVPVPRYERAALVPRILHLGVGGFHRAHLALYTHELAEAGSDWGICGLGRLEGDRRMQRVLASQDFLYTLIERDSEGSRPQVIGSIVGYALAVDDAHAFAQRVADPVVEILSLTITEGGYGLEQPNPTLEAIADGLDARRLAGGQPLTVMSCDNLPGNGRVAHAAVKQVCEGRDPKLGRYVETACTFPNSMVDRITPQTTDADRAWLRDTVGIDDGWPVVAEPFRQWVIEDRFAASRPHFEDVGVLLADNVHEWELYKLRMLNATHSCMAYLMALQGVVYVDEAMAIPSVRRFLERFLEAEAIPTLSEIPGHPAAAYARTVLARYENTGVRDQIARLCIDGTAKFPTFLIATIEGQIEREGPLECAALALAGWARYLATVPPGERAFDASGDRSAAFAARALAEPLAFLELAEVFTPPLRDSVRFRDAFANAANSLAAHGPLGAIDRLLGAE
ncbi:MAG: mannitol 2-dehydrogenase [Gaiellales bacterium]|nr:mannitol 2-dehydrogenase [Gaiellales bacterium]